RLRDRPIVVGESLSIRPLLEREACLTQRPARRSPFPSLESAMSLLTQLVDALNTGSLKVVDLTSPLGPDTPVIGLPPQFGNSPGLTMDVISCFDDKGPAWYWNVLHLGEHTGTHFDAPVHWITGKDLPDNTCETIPARRFVGPA